MPDRPDFPVVRLPGLRLERGRPSPLVATIAWQQMSPGTRNHAAALLSRHPDYERWLEKARSSNPAAIFAEAATWPDDIRGDPRFYDEERDAAAPPLPCLADTARHKRWHYVDLDHQGRRDGGEADLQIERLARVLRHGEHDELAYALPWLLHLVADIHQPLHVGHAEDDGGNGFEIENPFNKRLPFSSLHTYWDDLPGPPWLRGQRLEKLVQRLLAEYRRRPRELSPCGAARATGCWPKPIPMPLAACCPLSARISTSGRGRLPTSAWSPPATAWAGCSTAASALAFHVKPNRIPA